MSRHVAGRQRRWRWVILSLLFALTFAWSFAVMGDQTGVAWTILRLGSAVASVMSLLLFVLVSISSRHRRRAQSAEAAETEADGQPHPPTETRVPTYEEIFGLQPEPDEGSLPPAPEAEGQQGDEAVVMDAEVQPPSEQPKTEEHASTSDEDLQPVSADPDGSVDHGEAPDTDVDPEEHLRRMREQFKARAEQAALRVKERELHEAASAPDPRR